MSSRDPFGPTDHGPRRIDGLLTLPDRLAAWAEWFGIEPPPLRYTRGRPKSADNLLLTEDLLAWMDASGGSLGWFLSGDAREMAAAFRRQEQEVAAFKAVLRRFDEEEAGWLLDALLSGATGDALEETLLAFRAKVERHRASKAA